MLRDEAGAVAKGSGSKAYRPGRRLVKVVKKPDGYWVKDIPDCEPCGPYPTKVDAEETLRGLEQFYKYKDEPGFITCEDKRKR